MFTSIRVNSFLIDFNEFFTTTNKILFEKFKLSTIELSKIEIDSENCLKQNIVVQVLWIFTNFYKVWICLKFCSNKQHPQKMKQDCSYQVEALNVPTAF